MPSRNRWLVVAVGATLVHCNRYLSARLQADQVEPVEAKLRELRELK